MRKGYKYHHGTIGLTARQNIFDTRGKKGIRRGDEIDKKKREEKKIQQGGNRYGMLSSVCSCRKVCFLKNSIMPRSEKQNGPIHFHSGFTFQNTAAAAMLNKTTPTAVWTLIDGASNG